MDAELTRSTPIDELVVATKPAWPRQMLRVPWKPRAYPLPWINFIAPAMRTGGWKEIHPNRSRQADEHRLCFCCGEPLLDYCLMGRHSASFEKQGREVWLTDGPAAHPRCMALAATYCPHLLRQHKGDPEFVIALAWAGDTLGYIKMPEDMPSSTPRLLVRPGATSVTVGQLSRLAIIDPVGEHVQAIP